MCGLAGEVRFEGHADVGAVARMAEAMSARGPDGGGTWSREGVALAHRRLKVIDLSDAAAQPMVDTELGLTIAFNGCIYNYRDLRWDLIRHGYSFFSRSDTEILLKAYHCWGGDCVDRLVGMFAFCVCEHGTGRVVLGRDRLGIKPLYLAEVDGALRFASTLPALVTAGGVDTSIDRTALNHYLSFHSIVPPPRTILAGVTKLPPATLLTVEPNGRRTERRYWAARFARDPEREEMTEQDWADAVLESLRLAVERRMVADVPVGVLLSGGLDSSLIVALLADAGQTDLATFSVGFEDVGGRVGDEFEYSDLIADQFATDHHRISVSNGDMLPALGEAVAAMSEPMVSHDAVAFYLLSREVSRHVTVVQSGQGADEVFAGYSWYPPLLDADGDGAEVYAREFIDRTPAELEQAVAGPHLGAPGASTRFAREHFGRAGADGPLDRALRLDTEVMLVDDPVKRVDNMTMAWGLEARVPFLDHELVELAAACPPELKLAQDGKGVLKQAARRVLPSKVIDRPKGYFPVPALMHLEGRYEELVREALHAPAARARGLFEADYIDGLLADPNGQRTPLEGNKLWQLGLLELWLQTHGL